MSPPNEFNYFVHTLLRARDWQDRPEFDQVCQWWRGGGRGVCALVGMGGAGKTAIAERFLNALPNVMPAATSAGEPTRIAPSLPQPQSVFVYSFYEDDKPENFFRHLQIWLEGSPRLEPVLAVGQMMFLVEQRHGLIILDGLEKVQQSGARGGFGKLASPNLRDLLNHIACGSARELSVLLTSRLPLTDLRDSQPRFFHTIAVEEIDVAAGVQLLRDRGVRGSDLELASVVEECGRHALTIDLAGGYIKEYGNGDPTTRLSLGKTEELQSEVEQELNDDKRAVLKQGIRFARIAQRYREAMLKGDEAAIALLERICLFRLGVDSETLAAIFTGPAAEKVSGKALASLDAEELQKKLDWLVHMRLVEKSRRHALPDETHHVQRHDYVYLIHPAVRDGFLSGISGEAAQASHESVRRSLEVSLGDVPGANPSDPAALDLLEEIVHHTLESGHVHEAWDIYWNRIGGYQNLGWRLGAYERGERVCRAFAGGETPGTSGWDKYGEGKTSDSAVNANSMVKTSLSCRQRPYESLPEATQAIFINEWALYLKELGRLADAARCYEINIDMWMQQQRWRNVSIGKQNVSELLLLTGHLSSALSDSSAAFSLAEKTNDSQQRMMSAAVRAYILGLRGEVPNALNLFGEALYFQYIFDRRIPRQLSGAAGIWYAELLMRIRHKDAKKVLDEAESDARDVWGPSHFLVPEASLVGADLLISSNELPQAKSLCASARTWAWERDAKEVLCWSALVQARIELAWIGSQQPVREGERADHLAAAETATIQGLNISRDCGYGLFHIELLLERARLHLLRGDPGAALEDIELALDTGLPANDETGQPELLAANHEACGYAWAIPFGLQLRAEALLLRAAQAHGQESYLPAKISELPADVLLLIDQAKQNLHEALGCWYELRDPEAMKDNNFQLEGKEYNYRAASTYRVLNDIDDGTITRYPLSPFSASSSDLDESAIITLRQSTKRFRIAFSFPGSLRDFVRDVVEVVASEIGREHIFFDEFYEADLVRPNLDLYLAELFSNSELVVVFLSSEYDRERWSAVSWESTESILKRTPHVLPIRFDNKTHIPGVFSIDGYIAAKGRTPKQIADDILGRLGAHDIVDPNRVIRAVQRTIDMRLSPMKTGEGS